MLAGTKLKYTIKLTKLRFRQGGNQIRGWVYLHLPEGEFTTQETIPPRTQQCDLGPAGLRAGGKGLYCAAARLCYKCSHPASFHFFSPGCKLEIFTSLFWLFFPYFETPDIYFQTTIAQRFTVFTRAFRLETAGDTGDTSINCFAFH